MVWEPTYRERFPEWRSSDGALREKKSDGREEITGYRSSEEERRRGDEPQKIWDLSNAYGSLSAGWNKKKELVLVTTRQYGKEIHALPPESKCLDGQTAKKLPALIGFQINENSERQEESAFSFRAKGDRGPSYLMARLKQLPEKKELKVAESILPFLSVKEEREKLAYLRAKFGELAGNPHQKEAQAIHQRIQFLTAVVADKEEQQRMLYGKLTALLEEARKGFGADRDFVRFAKAEPEGLAEEDKNEDEDEADEDSKNEDDEK